MTSETPNLHVVKNLNISKTEKDIEKLKTPLRLVWKCCSDAFQIGSTIFRHRGTLNIKHCICGGIHSDRKFSIFLLNEYTDLVDIFTYPPFKLNGFPTTGPCRAIYTRKNINPWIWPTGGANWFFLQ